MKMPKAVIVISLVVILGSMTNCFAVAKMPELKKVFANDFLIGGALNDDMVSGKDPQAADIVRKQFSSITPENVIKWMHIHPEPDRYDFEAADRFVNFGIKNKMFIVGHTLVWHWQTPKWVFEDASGNDVDRETLLARMKEHIFAVVGRYKGKVNGWDVVNEALDDDGSLRQTKWLKIIGKDFIAKAFEYAHEADPNTELYYNDFTLDEPAKRDACVKLIKDLKAKGLRVDGVGLQGHWALDYPEPQDVEAFIKAMAAIGVKVMITELDIDVLPKAVQHRGADLSVRAELRKELDPYVLGLPDAMQKKLADRYAEFFNIFLKYPNEVARVTFWGVYDKTSWLNRFPVRGRTNYPLLFGRDYKPKPAFFAVVKTAKNETACRSAIGNKYALKDIFKKDFLIGAAVSYDQISGKDANIISIIKTQFNSVTPENCLKWESVHPEPNVYNFKQADKFVEFGKKNKMFIIGHILIDRSQVPDWVFQDSNGEKADRELLLKRMQEHISTVVGRYKGCINAWHVINEAIGRDGKIVKTKWFEIAGEDYIQKAFEYAHQADPKAELYYNGHDMLTKEATDSIVRLVKDIKSRGGRIDGIGVQAHWSLDNPSLKEVEDGIVNLTKSGVKIMVTEMDITVLPRPGSGKELNPYPNGLPDEMQEKLAKRYADLFSIFCRHADKIERINFWGIHDGQSWLNNWPIQGRANYPLLFDRNLQPKPAFFAVVKTAENKSKSEK
ncbi:MAG: endo-1,4-beta-xylanase [Sedimentisphaerales bacterium]